MDRGAWRTTGHGVAKSRTWLAHKQSWQLQGEFTYYVLAGACLLLYSSISFLLPACFQDSQVALVVNNLPANARDTETQVWSSSQEVPLEANMETHFNILALRIPWTEDTGGLQSIGSQRVGSDWSDSALMLPVRQPPLDTIAVAIEYCHPDANKWTKRYCFLQTQNACSHCSPNWSEKKKKGRERERDLPICFWVYLLHWF